MFLLKDDKISTIFQLLIFFILLMHMHETELYVVYIQFNLAVLSVILLRVDVRCHDNMLIMTSQGNLQTC